MPSYPEVASTTATLTSYVFTSLRAKIAAHPGPLYRLHIGDTWREPPTAAHSERLSTAEHPGLHRYAPVAGIPELLEAIGARVKRCHGADISPRDIQVVAGATGGLSVACQALLDPGDEVLLPSPFWPLIRGTIASRGAVPVEVQFYDRISGDATGDTLQALEDAITPRTRAIYLNSPHNPTGVILSGHTVDAIADLAERHNLWVLTDEVYEDLWYGEAAPVPLWLHPRLRHRSVAVHSMSKAYGLAGARVGYIHGPESAMRAIRAVQTFQAYCAPRPMQLAAARALNTGDPWLAETRQHYQEAAAAAAEVLGLPMPEGGTFLFFDVANHVPDGSDAMPFLERCLDAGVVLTPGGASGRGYETWVRLCYTVIHPDELPEALRLLKPLL